MQRILYIQYTNPAAYPPLEHSSGILAGAGWQVLFLGVEVPGAERLRFLKRAGLSVRQLPYWPAVPEKLRYFAFTLWVLVWTAIWRPRWVYASDSLACPVALLLSYVPGIRILYHEHDTPTAGSRGGIERWRLRARQALAERARLRVLPNEQRTVHFKQTVTPAAPTLTVWNCPSRAEVAPPRSARPDHARQLHLLYHGTVVPSRLPIAVLEAMATLPDGVRLSVVGYETVGHRGYRQQLGDVAHSLGIAHRIEFRAEMPHPLLMQYSRSSDVGLALMPTVTDDRNLQWMPGASNKAFDYLASGLAVVVSDLPVWREMYVEPGYGIACTAEDPTSVAAALTWLLDHPHEAHAMGERGRRQVEGAWNYESQFAAVYECLQDRAG